MKSTVQIKRNKARRIWIPILIVLLVAAGGLGYYWWTIKTASAAQAATAMTEETTKTATVRKGSITISVSGAGTLVAGAEKDLSFSTSGTVAELSVGVGDVVQKGDVLARLEEIEDLQAEVNTAKQNLIAAQEELKTMQESAAANLANAQLALAEAKEAVTDAKSGVVKEGWTRCDQETLEAYYYKYDHARKALDALGDGGGNAEYYLTAIIPAKNTVAQALAAYEYCAGYTDYEIVSSDATLSLTEAELVQAQKTYDTLSANGGVDPLELATAENKIANADLAVAQAQKTLDGATLTAPFDGTILSVSGEVGEKAGSSAFITIADLSHPRVEFSIDETDLDKLSVGAKANVIFDALPDRTFQGMVTRIDPSLVTSGSYQVVMGMIELDLTNETDAAQLIKGLNATVEIIQDSATDVLLVPLQAVRDLGDGMYAVFVVGSDGTPKMKVVEVGLQDAAYAEIKSGVSLGDVVTTGLTETN